MIEKPISIFIIDEHVEAAKDLKKALSTLKIPVEIHITTSAEEAFMMLNASMVDILITDFMLPGMSG